MDEIYLADGVFLFPAKNAVDLKSGRRSDRLLKIAAHASSLSGNELAKQFFQGPALYDVRWDLCWLNYWLNIGGEKTVLENKIYLILGEKPRHTSVYLRFSPSSQKNFLSYKTAAHLKTSNFFVRMHPKRVAILAYCKLEGTLWREKSCLSGFLSLPMFNLWLIPKMGTVSSVPICLSSLRSLWLSVR